MEKEDRTHQLPVCAGLAPGETADPQSPGKKNRVNSQDPEGNPDSSRKPYSNLAAQSLAILVHALRPIRFSIVYAGYWLSAACALTFRSERGTLSLALGLAGILVFLAGSLGQRCA